MTNIIPIRINKVIEDENIDLASDTSDKADQILKILHSAKDGVRTNKIFQENVSMFDKEEWLGTDNPYRMLHFILGAEEFLKSMELDTTKNNSLIYEVINANKLIFMKKENLLDDDEFNFLSNQLFKKI